MEGPQRWCQDSTRCRSARQGQGRMGRQAPSPSQGPARHRTTSRPWGGGEGLPRQGQAESAPGRGGRDPCRHVGGMQTLISSLIHPIILSAFISSCPSPHSHVVLSSFIQQSSHWSLHPCPPAATMLSFTPALTLTPSLTPLSMRGHSFIHHHPVLNVRPCPHFPSPLSFLRFRHLVCFLCYLLILLSVSSGGTVTATIQGLCFIRGCIPSTYTQSGLRGTC